MNKAILIVICDFLVSAMLTMMTGMVPGHSGGTGVGLDERTTKVLLTELNRRQLELEAMRMQQLEDIANSGTSPEKQEKLRKLTEELAANIAKQEKLEGKLIAKAADPADVDKLRGQLSSEENRRKELEEEVKRLRGDLAGNLQKIAEVSEDLRGKRRDNAVLTRQLEQTRDSLGETGKKLASARQELFDERQQHGSTKVKLSAAEKERAAAKKDADASKAELSGVRKELDAARSTLGATREKLAASETGRIAAEQKAAETGKKLDQTSAALRDTRDKLIREETSHQSTKKELSGTKKQLDSEKSAHDSTRKELTGTKSQLDSEKSAHAATREKLAVSETGRAAAQKEAEQKSRDLDSEREAHAKSRKDLDSERNAHEQSRKNLASEREALTKSRIESAKMDGKIRTQQRDIRNLQSNLSSTESKAAAFSEKVNVLELTLKKNEGELSGAKENNAALKDENRKLQQELMVAKMEQKEAETKAGMFENMHKEMVKELTEKEAELKKVQSEQNKTALAVVAEVVKHQEIQKQNVDVDAPVKKDVYKRYAEAVLRVDTGVWEKTGLFGNETLGGNITSFYPVVDFGKGRILITGSFDRFAGDYEKVLDFKEVFNVNMSWLLPYEKDSKDTRVPLTSYMIVNSRYPHLAGFKFPAGNKNITPLKPVSAKVLKERGLQNLLLFKSDAEGDHSPLDGRISLITTGDGKTALFIRNTLRTVNVVPGDIVLTSRGEFAGIASRPYRHNNVNGIIVPLFNDPAADWDQTDSVRLAEVKKDDFSDYGQKIRELRKKYPRMN